MKLVERLARELLEWPSGVESITQSTVDGELYFYHADDEMTESGIYLEQADSCRDVTRAQWEAERSRISGKEHFDAWSHGLHSALITDAFITDAFMAERAKRLKK